MVDQRLNGCSITTPFNFAPFNFKVCTEFNSQPHITDPTFNVAVSFEEGRRNDAEVLLKQRSSTGITREAASLDSSTGKCQSSINGTLWVGGPKGGNTPEQLVGGKGVGVGGRGVGAWGVGGVGAEGVGGPQPGGGGWGVGMSLRIQTATYELIDFAPQDDSRQRFI